MLLFKRASLSVFIIAAMAVFLFACDESEPEAVNGAGDDAPTDDADDNGAGDAAADGDDANGNGVFSMGETVQLGDYQVTVHGARWDDGDEFFGPDEGEQWLVIDAEIENTGDESGDVTIIDFELYDEENRSQDQALAADTDGDLSGTLGAGRTMRGEIAFAVPEGQANFEFIYSPLIDRGQAIFEITEGDIS